MNEETKNKERPENLKIHNLLSSQKHESSEDDSPYRDD